VAVAVVMPDQVVGVVALFRAHFSGWLPIQAVAGTAAAQGLEVGVAVEVKVQGETDQPRLLFGMGRNERCLYAHLV
jgi:hypothetical protein